MVYTLGTGFCNVVHNQLVQVKVIFGCFYMPQVYLTAILDISFYGQMENDKFSI